MSATSHETPRSKHKSQVLAAAQAHIQRDVVFDPHNMTHLEAFQMLLNGRQHPTIRFFCEPQYLNVRQMMLEKVATAYLAKVTKCGCSA